MNTVLNKLAANTGGNGWNMRPELFQKWRTALAKVLNGTADAKILCIGDSTTVGYLDSLNSTIPQNAAWPARLVSRLAARGIPAAPGMAVGPQATQTGIANDTRWTLGGNWARTGFGLAGTNSAGGRGSAFLGSTGNLVFDPNRSETRNSFSVYYTIFPGNGAFTATGTGGTPVAVNTDGLAGNGVITCTCAASNNTNTCTIAVTSSGENIIITGVEPFDSAVKRVRVANAGVGASTTADWVNGPNAYSGTGPIVTYAPDLTFICLGINDAGGSVAASTVAANILTLATACQLSGDVILMTMHPSLGTPYSTFEPQYVSAMRTMALTGGMGCIDIFARENGTWQTTLSADALHPNDPGHTDIAGCVMTELARISQ